MPINLRFTVALEDYLNAQSLHAQHHSWLGVKFFRARFVLPALGVGIILFGLLCFGAPWAFHIILIFVGIWFVLYPWRRRAYLKRRYRRTRTGKAHTSVEISEESIHVEGENADTELSWKGVQSYLEDQKTFLLYWAPAKFMILPKRSFTPEQISQLQSLLARKSVPTRP